jgi:hypothetical protein
MDDDKEHFERRYDSEEWKQKWVQTTKQQDVDLSPYFREIVTILFTVVVAFSIREYNTILFDNQSAPFDLQFVALLGAYLVIILSWIGYHFLISKYAYKSSTPFAQVRLISDLSIVFVYAYLLYAVRWLEQPVSDVPTFFDTTVSGGFWYAYILALAFVLYILNDFLARAEYPGSSAGHPRKSLVAIAGHLFLMSSYLTPSALVPLPLPNLEFLIHDWVVVWSALGIMIGWRLWIGIGKDK